MAFTGKLGTPDSRLGNIVPGLARPSALTGLAPVGVGSSSASSLVVAATGLAPIGVGSSSAAITVPIPETLGGSSLAAWYKTDIGAAFGDYLLATAKTTLGPGINCLPNQATIGATITMNGWIADPADMPTWWQVQLQSAKVVTGYSLTGSNYSVSRSPNTWTLQGSNDGSSWTVLDTQTGITWSSISQVKSFIFSNSTAYSYYRVNITATNGDPYTTLCEVTLAGLDLHTKWRDSSGRGNHLVAPQPTTQMPVYQASGGPLGLPYMDHTAAAGGLFTNVVSGLPTGDTTLFAVFETVSSGLQILMNGAGGNLTAYMNGLNVVVGTYGSVYYTTTAAVTSGAWTILLVTFTAIGNIVHVDLGGVIEDHTAGGTASFVPAGIDYGTNDVGNNFIGKMAEIGLYSSVLSAGDLTSLKNYLTTKYFGPVTPTTTGTAPASVASSSSSVLLATATGTAPVGVGSSSAASLVGSLVATGLSPVGVGSSSTVSLTIALIGWTADESQRTALELNVTDGVLVVDPPLAVAPDGTGGPGGTGGPLVVERMLRRQSHIMPVPTPDADGHVRVSEAWTIIEGDVGVLHVVVSGRDVTYFRGTPTLVDEWSAAEPFGDASAQVTFPQLSPFDVTGAGDLAWLHPGAPVEIFLLDVDGTTRHRRFAGHFISDEGGSSEDAANNVWQAEGALFQADHVGNPVPTILDPTDIGTLIGKSLNGVVSARFGAIANVTTGIKSRQRGSLGDSPIDYVQALLGTAWTDDASSQWTVAKKPNTHRQYLLRLKDRTTVHWTVTTGAPGVETALSRDLLSTVTAVYGRGIGPDGYAWAGWCYPKFLDDDAPAYPYSSGATVMSVGDTDAGTLTGHGVTDWQRRVNDLNLTGNVPVDGVYNTSDAAVCRAIQGDYGLLVDGIVGPQTWAGTFAVGSGGGDLTGAYRRPLAIDPRVDPHLYTASGAIDGPNPAYDRSVIRVDRDEDFGAGTTKADATRSAKAELARDKNPGLTGTITLTSDPHEGSRFLIDEGNNVRLLGFRGANPLLHIADLKASPETHQVTITVDEHARDAMTIAAIMKDTRDAAPDPARRPGAVNRRSRMEQDIAVQFDGESDGGRIPRHALYGGLWTVIRIPVSQMGQIAKLDIKTASPAAKFALALFGAPVTPAHLVNLVGDPLSGTNPFARTEGAGIALDDLGFIEAFGGPGSAAGYGRGQEGTGTLTGQLIDTGGLSYISAKPPWVWVAEWSPTSTFISGRIYPAPIQ